ncbi:hypothetical protein GCM10010404_63760 [Nonomuraea africana]|uniref:Glycosyltransferase RgtA/B/C/D-like domain-containing protein n=1 Tax=Nonomuraea africana TaxID=46171 RepID=A0ABR9KHY9_9ACTN|nr:hypothetical protein [Nonomuraea africana]MBE1561192.1 hypothetical protein [Nonomuraea africana]
MTITRPRVLSTVGEWRRLALRPGGVLALVSCLYGVAQLLLVSPALGIGWDEAVYASQFSAHAPPAVFSAPRAQGVPVLVTPVVAVTDSVVVLRLYLTVLSSLALYGAFAVWLRIRPDHLAPVAALLFGGCWLSLFYGNQAMPNGYVALAAVAAVGFLVLTGRSRPALVGLAGSLAVMSLMRPSDALVAALPLVVAALAGLRRNRIAALAAIAAGLAVGWGQWAIEAVARFGGLATRLRDAGVHNGTGWTVSVVEHARALDGPTLCRFGADCGPVSPVALIWWLAIPVMTALGLWSAWRARRLGPIALAAVTGVVMALPYLFYVDYAAPRFLTPTYALLSLPIAEAVVTATRLRRPVVVAMIAGLLAHFALQGAYAYRMAAINRQDRDEIGLAVQALHRMGVRPPCMIYGQSGVQIGYLLGCESQGIIQRFAQRPPLRIRQALERGDRLVVVYKNVRLPPYVRTWREVDLAGRWRARFPAMSADAPPLAVPHRPGGRAAPQGSQNRP